LLALDGSANDYFGVYVSISGDYAIVGAYYDDDKGNESGSAYIFKRNGENWTEQDKITPADGEANDRFGGSVSISGDYAIVGAIGDNDNGPISGSAYIFKREGTNWIQKEKLMASDGSANDYFGGTVSMRGNHAIVASYADDDNGTDSGSAYVFENICVLVEPDIDVSPLSHDFGDVELGTSSTVIVTISNMGNGDLNVSGIALETDFAITSVPPASVVVKPDETVDVEITYTPTVLGYNSAVLKIASDDPDEPVVEIQLSAAGVEIPPPPSEQIANILAFFDASVNDGSMVGDGQGNSAEKRFNALRNMVEAAGDLIENELFEEACQQLLDVYRRMDGQPKPPDFVKGEAAPELAAMIQELITSLGCE